MLEFLAWRVDFPDSALDDAPSSSPTAPPSTRPSGTGASPSAARSVFRSSPNHWSRPRSSACSGRRRSSRLRGGSPSRLSSTCSGTTSTSHARAASPCSTRSRRRRSRCTQRREAHGAAALRGGVGGPVLRAAPAGL